MRSAFLLPAAVLLASTLFPAPLKAEYPHHSLTVASGAFPKGQATVSIPISLVNPSPIAGISGRIVFDSGLLSPVITDSAAGSVQIDQLDRGAALSIFSANTPQPGVVNFIMISRTTGPIEKIGPGSGPVLQIHFNILTAADTSICIRLEDDPDPSGFKNQLADTLGLLIIPSLRPGTLTLGAGSLLTACPEIIDGTGDLNQNGVAFEIADYVLFVNYFVYGEIIFSSNPPIREAQIRASDVNHDGLTLRASDLVYLIRVITGESNPLPGPDVLSASDTAQFRIVQHPDRLEISSGSPADLSGIFLRLNHFGTAGTPVALGSAQNLDLAYNITPGELRLILVSALTLPLAKIPAGEETILSIPFSGWLDSVEIQASTREGEEIFASTTITAGPPPTNCAELIVNTFSLSGVQQLRTGAAFGSRLTASIKNIGDMAGSNPFPVKVYLSVDPQITTSDRPLAGGHVTINSISAGEVVGVQVSPALSIPADWPVGPAYLGIFIDEDGNVSECNELNNTVSFTVSIENSRSLSDSLKVLSVALYAGQTTVSIPVSLVNSVPISGIQGRMVFDSSIIAPQLIPGNLVSMDRVDRGNALLTFGASSRSGGVVTFLMLSNPFQLEKINPGSGPVCRINFDVLTSQDTTICIRLEDDPSNSLEVKNLLSDDGGYLVIPSLKPGALLLGAGNPLADCSPAAYTRGDLNLDEFLTSPDVVLELNCVFMNGSWNCPKSLADLNCDGELTAADVVEILNRAFLGTPPACP